MAEVRRDEMIHAVRRCSERERQRGAAVHVPKIVFRVKRGSLLQRCGVYVWCRCVTRKVERGRCQICNGVCGDAVCAAPWQCGVA